MDALYGDSLGEALRFAAWLHRDQSRKRAVAEPRLSKPVPYITHLLDVASLALAAGADDDQTVAALLHDAFEDQPTTPAGDDTRSEIGTRFGPRVVELIDACTDQTGDPDAPRDSSTWAERKTHHIAALSARGANDPAVLLVPLADKAANCRAIVEDVRADGRDVSGNVATRRDHAAADERERRGGDVSYQGGSQAFLRAARLPVRARLQRSGEKSVGVPNSLWRQWFAARDFPISQLDV